MRTRILHYVSHKECPYTWRGENIANLRRSKLQDIAASFQIGTPDSSKQEILAQLVPRLNGLGAETEISDIVER